MATYYTIQTWKGEMLDSETFNLYETFDEACDTIEGYVRAYEDFDESYLEKIKSNREEKRKNIESWNRVAYLKMLSGEMKYITRMTVIPKKPDTVDCDEQDRYLEENFEEVFGRSKKVKTLNGRPVRNLWYDPTTRWAYQVYFSEGEKPQTFYDPESNIINAIEFEKKYVYQYFVRNNEQTTSPKYETFDGVCDAIDKELRKLHGEDWRPRMTREERKNIMEFFALSPIYFYYKTDMYILFRMEV